MTLENEVSEEQVMDAWNGSADSRYLAYVGIDGNTIIWDGEYVPIGQIVHVPAFGDNPDFEYNFA